MWILSSQTYLVDSIDKFSDLFSLHFGLPKVLYCRTWSGEAPREKAIGYCSILYFIFPNGVAPSQWWCPIEIIKSSRNTSMWENEKHSSTRTTGRYRTTVYGEREQSRCHWTRIASRAAGSVTRSQSSCLECTRLPTPTTPPPAVGKTPLTEIYQQLSVSFPVFFFIIKNFIFTSDR